MLSDWFASHVLYEIHLSTARVISCSRYMLMDGGRSQYSSSRRLPSQRPLFKTTFQDVNYQLCLWQQNQVSQKMIFNPEKLFFVPKPNLTKKIVLSQNTISD